MKNKIIESSGFQIGDYHVPQFKLYENELLGICIGNSADSGLIEKRLIEFFTAKENYIRPEYILNYAKTYWETVDAESITVGEYIQQYGKSNSEVYQTIYKVDEINPDLRLDKLPGTPRKILSLATLSSKESNILFNTEALDRVGIREVLEFVLKHVVNKNGTAVWIDHYGERIERCANYIRIEKAKPLN